MIEVISALLLSMGAATVPRPTTELPPGLLVLRGCARRECRLEATPGAPPLFTQVATVALRPESLITGLAVRLESETQGTPIAAAAGLLSSSRLQLRLRTNQVQLAMRF